MTHTTTPLEQEFVRDHQAMTKGFSRILEALNADDWPAAVEAARNVDRDAGPHLAFEEDELYPRVAEHRGADFSRQLLDEHRVARDAVRFLLQHPRPEGVQPEDRAKLIDQIQTGLDHAVSCGALLSYVTVLSDAAQQELLASIRQHREQAMRMIDLPDVGGETPANTSIHEGDQP